MDLFTINMEDNLRKSAPLASRLRPENLADFVGQKHLVGEGRYLNRVIKSDRLSSMIFYGPPGVGKTTLAKIIANTTRKNFIQVSAVTSNVKELKEVFRQAEDSLKFNNVNSVLFIDEIHRFNKSQQDLLLPYVEKGIVVLIGATTENPYFEINKALLSRCQILTLHSLEYADFDILLKRAMQTEYKNLNVEIDEDAKEFLYRNSSGDGRNMLNSFEIAVLSTDEIDGKIIINESVMEDCLQVKNLQYDKNGNEHYDTISAFIKSIRGTDPDAAIYYLAKMLESGEDPKFIARRLIISASEDISNADPMALLIANTAFEAVNNVGMPEARIILSQAVCYLATAPKSNRSYLAINNALDDIRKLKNMKMPLYLKDSHAPNDEISEGKYKYPHNYEKSYVRQRYLPKEIENKKYYIPSDNGYEKRIAQYVEKLKGEK